ncbi:hypothetical protein ARMGADRAFT_1037226 [Armillaria gallica]|uniref:WD40 repeat-like protein n=1 Tax=Armillaria gallica TaxID=47427 RepID=A0A2H3CS92_ARMGA|nr:hypothetical protein ARMGADRAFT_1037226 [Armillaria gallica]
MRLPHATTFTNDSHKILVFGLNTGDMTTMAASNGEILSTINLKCPITSLEELYVRFHENAAVVGGGSGRGKVYVVSLQQNTVIQELHHRGDTEPVQAIDAICVGDCYRIASGSSASEPDICIWEKEIKTATVPDQVTGQASIFEASALVDNKNYLEIVVYIYVILRIIPISDSTVVPVMWMVDIEVLDMQEVLVDCQTQLQHGIGAKSMAWAQKEVSISAIEESKTSIENQHWKLQLITPVK